MTSMILPVAQPGWSQPPGSLGPENTVFIELPYAPGWEAAVEVIEAAGLYGKIAAGQAEPRQVVEQLSILIEADLPFKITSPLDGDWLALLRRSKPWSLAPALRMPRNSCDSMTMIKSAPAVASWDQTTQSRVRRRVRRLGTDRVQDVISGLTTYG